MLWMLLAACTDVDPELPPEPPPGEPAPDILLITIDTLRADRVGAYGDPLALTPTLDELASTGVLFTEAHAVTPLTLPSHASLLTGRYPVNHGLRDNAGFRLQGVPTLAEALQADGYQTAAFVSAYVLDSAWGLDAGFETYRDPFHPQDIGQSGAFGEVELPSAEVLNAAVAWWRSATSPPGDGETAAPRFAWVHLYDPHTPWRDRPDWTGDPYRGEVAYVDGLQRRLVDEEGRDTLIAVTSDHGEGLWDHGEREHGVLLGRSVTRVPFILRPPGGLKAATERTLPTLPDKPAPAVARPPGLDQDLVLSEVPDAPHAARVISTPVSGVDLAPTLADYAGVTLTAPDGRSLRPAAEGAPLEALPVYAESWVPWFHYGWASMHMAMDASERLERGAQDQAHAWPQDPWGTTAAAATPTELGAAIDRWKGADDPTPGPIDSETAAALQALGYVSTPASETTGDLPDPRDRIDAVSRLQAAGQLGPMARERALEELLDREPDMADAWIELALTRTELGELDAAWEANETVLRRWPDHPLALSNAGVLARMRGESDLAVELARRMQTLNPNDARGYRLEATVLVEQEDAPGVLAVTRKGLEVAPEDPNLHYLYALAEVQAGDPLAALPHLEAARQHGSRATDIDLWLGVANERGGRIDQAKKHYEDATKSMPGDPRPWAMAGWMLYKADRCDEAMPFLINIARRGAARDPKVAEAVKACQDG